MARILDPGVGGVTEWYQSLELKYSGTREREKRVKGIIVTKGVKNSHRVQGRTTGYSIDR